MGGANKECRTVLIQCYFLEFDFGLCFILYMIGSIAYICIYSNMDILILNINLHLTDVTFRKLTFIFLLLFYFYCAETNLIL